ncbi:uncharacterized protein LOC115736073 [Rhodamnia argentea]|uniref:Uncharacterized protein LOC115736073 n=1 Tax=Rhodamnia argentea TaxID=178133 RepID=A0ABM3HCG2_9MYRT|nr:uncharacterized protein LOC115736073 [Rhodamnia argentea]XP_048134267.1 uncharacterized protein LOC115736073 [Rhodamnia argentea]
MIGTTTGVGHHATVKSMLRSGCHHIGWASKMMCLWDDWSIQLFVLLGFIFQIVLAVLGSRRKISSADSTRFFTWASYLLASYFATLALGKLTVVSFNKSEEEYDTELKALLAPLILLQLGNPDSITAYSVEDNRLSTRRVLNLVLTFSFVVWILRRSWKTSIQMTLYFPMLVAGIIKYGETIWALSSVYDENTNLKQEDFDEETEMYSELTDFRSEIPNLEIFLKAYFRFDCLKPHLADWMKQPFFLKHRNKLIEQSSPKEIFLITDLELGFMYDVLYTKAPVLYTGCGIALRVIGYLSLLLTLGGFVGLFFEKHLRDPYVIYTFGLLIGVVLLETYQLLKLFCSDWVIVRSNKLLKNAMLLKFLKLLVKCSLKKERWSNTIPQFNFLDFCQADRRPWLFRILRFFGMAEKFRKRWAPNSMRFPEYLKGFLLEDIKKFETKRDGRPFRKRGEWSLGIHGSVDNLKWSIEMAFDRSIIVWHIATHVCYYSCHEKTDRKEASKLISDYMMFLLVRHPSMLSSTTADLTFSHAYTKFMKFLNRIPESQRGVGKVLEVLTGPEPVRERDSERSLKTPITGGWNVLEEARKLARELESRTDTWELICSVWAEMLCFAAYNCQRYNHLKLLRQGGEIITHVWLLLSHKTDKFKTINSSNIVSE